MLVPIPLWGERFWTPPDLAGSRPGKIPGFFRKSVQNFSKIPLTPLAEFLGPPGENRRFRTDPDPIWGPTGPVFDDPGDPEIDDFGRSGHDLDTIRPDLKSI